MLLLLMTTTSIVVCFLYISFLVFIVHCTNNEYVKRCDNNYNVFVWEFWLPTTNKQETNDDNEDPLFVSLASLYDSNHF